MSINSIEFRKRNQIPSTWKIHPLICLKISGNTVKNEQKKTFYFRKFDQKFFEWLWNGKYIFPLHNLLPVKQKLFTFLSHVQCLW